MCPPEPTLPRQPLRDGLWRSPSVAVMRSRRMGGVPWCLVDGSYFPYQLRPFL